MCKKGIIMVDNHEPNKWKRNHQSADTIFRHPRENCFPDVLLFYMKRNFLFPGKLKCLLVFNKIMSQTLAKTHKNFALNS